MDPDRALGTGGRRDPPTTERHKRIRLRIQSNMAEQAKKKKRARSTEAEAMVDEPMSEAKEVADEDKKSGDELVGGEDKRQKKEKKRAAAPRNPDVLIREREFIKNELLRSCIKALPDDRPSIQREEFNVLMSGLVHDFVVDVAELSTDTAVGRNRASKKTTILAKDIDSAIRNLLETVPRYRFVKKAVLSATREHASSIAEVNENRKAWRDQWCKETGEERAPPVWADPKKKREKSAGEEPRAGKRKAGPPVFPDTRREIGDHSVSTWMEMTRMPKGDRQFINAQRLRRFFSANLRLAGPTVTLGAVQTLMHAIAALYRAAAKPVVYAALLAAKRKDAKKGRKAGGARRQEGEAEAEKTQHNLVLNIEAIVAAIINADVELQRTEGPYKVHPDVAMYDLFERYLWSLSPDLYASIISVYETKRRSQLADFSRMSRKA